MSCFNTIERLSYAEKRTKFPFLAPRGLFSILFSFYLETAEKNGNLIKSFIFIYFCLPLWNFYLAECISSSFCTAFLKWIIIFSGIYFSSFHRNSLESCVFFSLIVSGSHSTMLGWGVIKLRDLYDMLTSKTLCCYYFVISINNSYVLIQFNMLKNI